jgi:D-alanyl-lipoteichoic acid acyltransferase DltB (MBOAT superfamily)
LLFNSFEYVAFFLVVYALYWVFAHHARIAMGLLLGASLLFYACWNPYYLILIINSLLVDFITGKKLGETEDPIRRKRLMLTSVIYNLSILGVFKYFNFFMQSFDDVVTHFELWDSFMWGEIYLPGGRLAALLPVGISFFTFQSMSYTIDIYRGGLKPVKSFAHYLLFVSFFPQLVAGPIVRARDLLPQLLTRPSVSPEMSGRGLYLIMLGLFKKIAVADYLAINLVDRVFTTPEGYSSFESLLGVYGYALQIYCDFSGYSDIAIGSALLLGFSFPDNFATPYQSKNLQDFWRRWHISLSSWLRDYLYISLGGNRKGSARTYVNLMLTMLLGGLWHGAGWNFIIWGLMHGGALALHRLWHERADQVKWYQRVKDTSSWHIVSLLATFHYVCLAWIFFRAPTLGEATRVIGHLFEGGFSTLNINAHLWWVLILGFLAHSCPRRIFDQTIDRFSHLSSHAQAALLLGIALILRQLAVAEAVPFIYFQF